MTYNYFVKECKNVKSGKRDLESFIKTLTYKKYIPIQEKIETANLVNVLISDDLMPYNFENSDANSTTNIETDKIVLNYGTIKFLCILLKYLNIEPNFARVDGDVIKAYDIIHEIGLADFFINELKYDFNRFNEIVDNITGIKYFALTNTIMNLFNNVPTQEKIEQFEKSLEKLDKEKLDALSEIANFNDPMTGKVTDALKLNVALEQLAKEENKKENKENKNITVIQ